MAKELTKTLLILSADPKALLPAEQFLVNREWIVRTISDEKMALSTLVETMPCFFMISVDHPNKKILGLKRLLAQTLPELKVVFFAEGNTIDSYRLLTELGNTTSKIFPPVTGPAIERAVNRFLKADHDKKVQERIHLKSIRRALNDEAESLTWAPPKNGESLIFKGAIEVLDGIVEKEDGVIRQKLTGATTNTACIVIESERFKGYLITAMAGDRAFDYHFIHLVRQRLVKYLRDNGEFVKDGDSFPLKVQPVEFEAWASDYAEFLKKTVHKGQEMAFAFFPVSDVNPTIGKSMMAEMATIPVAALMADAQVDFHVHLLMPANRKFIVYTPAGSIFFGAQKNRLMRGGVKELHIKQGDIDKFKAYHARHKVDLLINDYEQRQRLASA